MSNSSRSAIQLKSDSSIRYRSNAKTPLKVSRVQEETKSRSVSAINKSKNRLSPIFKKEDRIESEFFKISQQLYSAKCDDLSISPMPDQERRFYLNFEKNAKQRKILLPENKLGLKSGILLSKILYKSQFFSYINISRNKIGDLGMKYITKSLLNNDSIVHLDISSNDLSQVGCSQVLELLCKHPSLHSLDLSSHQFLYRNKIGACEKLFKLIRVPTLAYLNLSGTNIGSEGLKYIILGLEKNTNLCSLNLSNNGIKGNLIKDLVQVLVTSKLNYLMLENNLIEEIGALEFSYFFSGYYGYGIITQINLGGNSIPTSGAYNFFESLIKENYLEHLNIENNNFGGYLDILKRFLTENKRLKYLNLNSCNIKLEAFLKLCDGLTENKGLETLILSNNSCRDLGASSISKALIVNRTLKNLDLSNNLIKSDGGIGLASALKLNKSLKVLILNDNELKDDSGELFYHALGNNYTLIKLKLHINPMSAKYQLDIKKYLERNKNLEQKQEISKIKESKVLLDVEKCSENIKNKIIEHEHEKEQIKKKVESYQQRINAIKLEEEIKLNNLKNLLQECKKNNLKLSKTLIDINQDIRVTFIKNTGIIHDKNVKNYENKIFEIDLDIRNLESQSNLY